MSMIGLELNDCGIMAAGGKPAGLIELDGHSVESPGFALPDNDRLLVGKAAQQAARLNPRFFTERFWDELNTVPLVQPGLEGQNNAELAYAHLAMIWRAAKRYGPETALAVPGFFNQEQLGLLLGISRELNLPVKGFASAAIAATAQSIPEPLIFYVDIHLHRLEIVLLEQTTRLAQTSVETLPGKGLSHLYGLWVRTIADEFVRTTRFDPFHQAQTEQELYTRLPAILRDITNRPALNIEMQAGSHLHQVNLNTELLIQKSNGIYREVCARIEEMRCAAGRQLQPAAIELTHRACSLPGLPAAVRQLPQARLIKLKPGAAALGLLELQEAFTPADSSTGVAFITSRNTDTISPLPAPEAIRNTRENQVPTHVRCGDRAYRLSEKPLIISCSADNQTVHITNHAPKGSTVYGAIQLSREKVQLVSHSENDLFINEEKVNGQAFAGLGQYIKLAGTTQKLHLIICIEQ
ncbi:MAG: hypothetical protein GY868_17925 [Deltaproteobacteria bacterium]|nr:hypothetical protein [Deltaproteobacteria bacterium]